MPDNPDVLAASSPAPEAPPLEPQQMTKEQRSDWLLKGEIPTTADAPADPEASAPSTENADGTAVEPAPASQPASQDSKPKKNAATRIQELLAEKKELERQLTQARAPKSDAPPASSAPAPAAPPPAAAQPPAQPPAQPAKLERPTRPQLANFETYEKYEAALDTYHEQMAGFKAAETIAQYQASQAKAAEQRQIQEANRQIETSWKEQVAKGQEAHDDYSDVVGTLGSVIPRNTPTGAAIDSFVLQSDHGGELAYRLGADGAKEARRISQLSPLQAFRELVKLELAIDGPAPVSSSAKTPPTKPSRTPAPPVDLKGRNAAPADEVMKAVADDDFRRFKQLEDQKILARK